MINKLIENVGLGISANSESFIWAGCRIWGKPDHDGKQLLIFPYDWYCDIPNGMLLEDVNGEVFNFEKGKTDDDTRAGLLAYGVRL